MGESGTQETRTVVITGGTDGLGKGVALHYLRRGAHVIVVGSTRAKGTAFLSEAEAEETATATATATAKAGVPAGRATFLQADLTSISSAKRLVATIRRTHTQVDKVILCAQRYRLLGPRSVTPEGLEHSFALAYLSRHILSHGLRETLESTPAPVIMNVGTPGVPLGRIHWDDPQLTHHYGGARATLQSFRANDLLGVAFADLHPGTPVRYIAYNPGVVATGMPDHLPQPLRTAARAAFTALATPVQKAVAPMAALLDDPPDAPFTAYRTRRRLPLTGAAFDLSAARRLHHLTEDLVDRFTHADRPPDQPADRPTEPDPAHGTNNGA
ncbi:hypothetical protein B1H18_15515 [Streptomyces tsukubensis]|uniref:Oxidoreductase n=2 Tax=Streptomyces tsukubensis TaxID=83656 RepID=A0A1V4A976_9ACTN|nr:hypothetical protein B1H18_15515 [Streptomyces tsukubensis]